jgi:hypothetical protein
MSKPRFSIGEFVCAVNHESSTLFYIYDYLTGSTHPYSIISIKRATTYVAKAKDLRAITNIINMVTISLKSKGNNTDVIKYSRNLRSTRLEGYPMIGNYPLGWTLDLINKETKYADV